MRPPATSRGARSPKATRASAPQARRANAPKAPSKGAQKSSRRSKAVPRPPEPRDGEIKITRNSTRPQIKASRGPTARPKTRKVATGKRMSEADRRVAATRRQSISSLSASSEKLRSSAPSAGGASRSGARSANASRSSGGGSVRAVAVSGAGGAAAATARAVAVAAKPVGAAARPMLRVVNGGLDMLPTAKESTSPFARGRILIMIVGVLAAGLIYINVGKLEYGDGYGKYAQRSLELQRENTALRAQIARRSTPERIQRYAQKLGMISPVPEQFEYLDPRRGDAVKAAKGYKEPSPVAPAPTAAPTPTTTTAPAAPAPAQTAPAPAPTTPTPTTPTPAPAATGGAGL